MLFFDVNFKYKKNVDIFTIIHIYTETFLFENFDYTYMYTWNLKIAMDYFC